MNIAIDYGNSAAKVGIFDHQNLMEQHSFADKENLLRFLNQTDVDHLIISSVKEEPNELSSWLPSTKRHFILTKELPLPITNLYETPGTLGMDRLAGVCGAQQIFPLQHCLVIDAGTCITYDLVDKEGRYHGGGIGPGLNMRFKAVHTFTAKLPLISPKENVPLIGTSTESSIRSGVINGMLAEIDGIIARYNQEFDGLRVILCGGDARFFENQLKAAIFASPELVLIGLNSILNHNVKL